MSLTSSLYIAATGLTASQSAMTVISNNIANVDNEDYSKLRLNLTDLVNCSSPTNPIAEANSLSGVNVASITRYADSYLESTYRDTNSDNSYLKKYDTMASGIETTMNELKDTGLSNALSNFYAAVKSLNNSPNNPSARENFVSAAQNLCSVFNSAAASLTQTQQSLVGDYNNPNTIASSEMSIDVNSVNNLLDQIAEVNKNIIQSNSADVTSSALLDQRDALLLKLSNYIPANVTENDNGTVKVSLGSTALVSGVDVTGYLKASAGNAAEPAVIDIVDKNGTTVASDVNSRITSGSIGAILDITGTSSAKFTISSVLDNLNTLAGNFANIMNTIQAGDPNGDSSTAMSIDKTTNTLTDSTNLLFVSNSSPSVTTTTTSHATIPGDVAGTVITNTTDAFGNKITNMITTNIDGLGNTTVTTKSQAAVTAANISVNSAIVSDSDLVAAARISATEHAAGNYANETGNNSNANLIMASQTKAYTGLDDQTISGFLSTAVSEVGTAVDSLDNNLKTKTSVLDSIKSKLQSETSVNLDEELTEMIKYQRAYQASARVFSACSDLLDTLVNLGQ